MNESTSQEAEPEKPEPKWQPISATDRRVLGVLAEKAKTTPEQYPLSLNGLRTGCNQKSNRYPVMELDTDAIEDAIDRLRHVGAATEIQGGGRVSKYRHHLYEWLGVSKVELAVMAELLLRGAQTEGELRGRAARMEPIADVSALRPILEELMTRGLVVSLTPKGRGHIITHGLYTPAEMERLQAKHGPAPVATPPRVAPPAPSPAPAASAAPVASSAPQHASRPVEETESLRRELQDARLQIGELERQVANLEQRLDRTDDDLRSLKESLGA